MYRACEKIRTGKVAPSLAEGVQMVTSIPPMRVDLSSAALAGLTGCNSSAATTPNRMEIRRHFTLRKGT